MKAKLPSKTVYDLKGRKIELTNGSEYDIDNFTPARQAANDGDVIDFNNKARTKSTLVGAGGGAALGALAGASGADAEIQERWVTAVREYNDPLGNISCSTGDRWLSKYNDMVIIPEMKTAE